MAADDIEHQAASPATRAASAPAQAESPPTQAASPTRTQAASPTTTQAESPPTRTESPPTQAESPPTQTESPPRQTESPPTQAESPPTRTESPPTQTESPPTRTESPPTQAESPPTQSESPPTQSESPPTQAESPPTQAESPSATQIIASSPRDLLSQLVHLSGPFCREKIDHLIASLGPDAPDRWPATLIVLIVSRIWSPSRRRRVERNLSLLSSNSNPGSHSSSADPDALFVWRSLGVWRHYTQALEHIRCVGRAYDLFGARLRALRCHPLLLPPPQPPEDGMRRSRNCSWRQIRAHDRSKLRFPECVAYTVKWHWPQQHQQQPLSDADRQRAWQLGLRHHYRRNGHHPEHFAQGRRMPWRFLCEAVCDMIGIELEKRFAGREPGDVSQLLEMSDTYLERFKRTAQWELVHRVLELLKKQQQE